MTHTTSLAFPTCNTPLFYPSLYGPYPPHPSYLPTLRHPPPLPCVFNHLRSFLVPNGQISRLLGNMQGTCWPKSKRPCNGARILLCNLSLFGIIAQTLDTFCCCGHVFPTN